MTGEYKYKKSNNGSRSSAFERYEPIFLNSKEDVARALTNKNIRQSFRFTGHVLSVQEPAPT